jgi:hypothetical protein
LNVITHPHRKVHLELKANATPSQSRPYPVPRHHEAFFKEELNWLCKIRVLSRCGASTSPYTVNHISVTNFVVKPVIFSIDVRINCLFSRGLQFLPWDFLNSKSYVYHLWYQRGDLSWSLIFLMVGCSRTHPQKARKSAWRMNHSKTPRFPRPTGLFRECFVLKRENMVNNNLIKTILPRCRCSLVVFTRTDGLTGGPLRQPSILKAFQLRESVDTLG